MRPDVLLRLAVAVLLAGALQAQWVSCAGGSQTCTNAGVNVGIGTTDPIALLNVQPPSPGSTPLLSVNNFSNVGAANFTAFIHSDQTYLGGNNSSVYSGAVLEVTSFPDGSTNITGDTLRVGTSYSDGTGFNPQLVVKAATGNIGIGTSTPSSVLDVNGQVAIEQKNFGGPAGLLIKGLNAIDNWPTIGMSLQNTSGVDVLGANIYGQITNTTPGSESMNLLFLTSAGSGASAERMRITSNGYIGFGTADPQNALAVNGTVQAKEVLVNTGWSDYVFGPGYRLAPLSEVAAYVENEHHLPGIPSAAEVRANGVSLGEMQAKLLAKIEELTLHMIEAEKESAELRRKNQELAERIARLERGGEGK